MFPHMRSNAFYQPFRSRIGGARNVPGATDFLRSSSTLAALMPTVTRLVSLQSDCAKALPAMFAGCDILQFHEGELLLATPNAAVAAKLKQQLPKLQAELLKRGWQLSAIRLKVQVNKPVAPEVIMRSLSLPERAVSAFAELGDTLEQSPQNGALIAALRAMVQRRRDGGG